jgi:hypothetical protein
MTDGGVIPTDKQIRLVAAACHEVLRAHSLARGAPNPRMWAQLATDERELMMYGVRQVLRGITPVELHRAWYEQRVASGWPLHHGSYVSRPHPDQAAPTDDEQLQDQLFYDTVRTMLDVMHGHDHG